MCTASYSSRSSIGTLEITMLHTASACGGAGPNSAGSQGFQRFFKTIQEEIIELSLTIVLQFHSCFFASIQMHPFVLLWRHFRSCEAEEKAEMNYSANTPSFKRRLLVGFVRFFILEISTRIYLLVSNSCREKSETPHHGHSICSCRRRARSQVSCKKTE